MLQHPDKTSLVSLIEIPFAFAFCLVLATTISAASHQGDPALYQIDMEKGCRISFIAAAAKTEG